ncbi:DNA primase [bacterium]|nr:DNA primase [bacterium]
MNKSRKSEGVLTGGFSQVFIQKVQDAVNFEEIVSRYTSLRRRGSRLLGLCPFHAEKTPSFSVDPDRGLFYCFGCGKGGNIFTFLMEKESISFPEAVAQLAKEAGIPIPRREISSSKEQYLDELYKANEFALKLFRSYLDKGVGEKARKYLKERGLSDTTIKEFYLGYVPQRWDSLYSAVSKAGLKLDPFLKTGLLRKKESGGCYDSYRGRIMFPILNPSKRVVAFAGREFDKQEEGAKYINSPESPIYQKNRVVYGIWSTMNHIRKDKNVILVEGYTDLLALWQAGIKNVTASCGTAFTEQQANFIRRYSTDAIILFDGDEAGLNATMRTIPILLSAGINVKCLRLPPEEDPASFIANEGVEKLNGILETAPGWFELVYDMTCQKYEPTNPDDKVRIVYELTKYFTSISDNLKLRVYVHKLSSSLLLPEELIVNEIEKKKKKSISPMTIEDSQEKFAFNQQQKNELEFISLLIHENAYIKKLDLRECRVLFINYPGILINIEDLFGERGKIEFSDLSNSIIDSKVRGFITEKMFKFKNMSTDEYFKGLINKLFSLKLKREISRLTEKLRIAEKNSDNSEAAELNKQIVNLQQKRRESFNVN